MSGASTLFLSTMCTFLAASAHATGASRFSGMSALAFTQQVVELGPRPPGSAAHAKAQQIIAARLQTLGWQITRDAFTARTPHGPKPMCNLLAVRRAAASQGRALVISGHYDTKYMPGIRFVGANDGGSSTGFLLELARVLPALRHTDIFLVWFDGEESFAEWTAADSLYGSRHLAARWAAEGVLPRVKAMINVDMIGDRELGILGESTGPRWLMQLVWSAADRLGYGRHFSRERAWVADDHVPFVERGVPAIDLIDLDYGPGNAYWHTEQDTMDKLAPGSFQVVGDTLLEVIHQLDKEGK